MTTPYYQDEQVTLYHGTIADVLPTINAEIDLIMADPPYAETSLAWDRWPDGWPSLLDGYGASMWCFGSMRMFLDRAAEFAGWKLSQDVVWQKNRRTTVATDRFARIHEHALHWYRGDWRSIHHTPPKVPRVGPSKGTAHRSATPPNINGARGAVTWHDDGTRWQSTVINVASVWRDRGLNETEKPAGILRPLIQYGCPPRGTVLDLFAGSASASLEARNLGMNSIAIEAREAQCESAALRLSAGVLDLS